MECLEKLQQTPGVWVQTLRGKDMGKMAGRDPQTVRLLEWLHEPPPERWKKRKRGHWRMRMELVPQRWRWPISW